MRILATVLALGLSATAAFGQAADAIENVISQQLEAFNDRDVPKAFAFASPMIKRLFGNPGNFGMMVAQGYPMVWDNSDVRFLERRALGPVQMQKVLMIDPQGVPHVIEYKMIETKRGWEIDGVQLLAPPDVGA